MLFFVQTESGLFPVRGAAFRAYSAGILIIIPQMCRSRHANFRLWGCTVNLR